MFQALFGWPSRRPRQGPPSRFRPRLEALEDRMVPAPVELIGSTTGPALVRQNAPAAAASQPQQTTGPVYIVNKITHRYEFVDSVYATRVGGVYRVSLTVAHGCCVEGGTLQQTLPVVGGSVFMVVSTRRLGPNWGDLGISQVVSWWNGKPTIKGLNYVRHMTVPRAFLDRLRPHDLIRWVPPAKVGGQGQWKLDREMTEVDKLLASEYSPQRLPNLLKGRITAIGPSTDQYNCFGYAANSSNPAGVGWVAPIAPPGAPKHVLVTSGKGLLDFYAQHGWKQQAVQDFTPPKPGEQRVVVYATFQNGQPFFQHAALWRADGVFAKMGRLGTFRFDNIGQMAGGAFGKPFLVLKRG